jgi:hypothetical protein
MSHSISNKPFIYLFFSGMIIIIEMKLIKIILILVMFFILGNLAFSHLHSSKNNTKENFFAESSPEAKTRAVLV